MNHENILQEPTDEMRLQTRTLQIKVRCLTNLVGVAEL
jgi:hypothetical protein